ncbi:hypothetical protein LML29_004197, partial [Salmonella enterica]|nr:hypothetical protein [Salmonella enterica]EIL9647839.1 hypothetical protein [Salmonella enterica]EIP7215794.1 hypothetical protein [Salmonella enterica]
MKRLNKSIICILLAASSSSAFAGEYTQTGYITEVKANEQGDVCDIMISSTPTSAGFQGGQWSCNSIVSQNMFKVAKLAKIMGYKGSITLEGNGATYKPVYSID